MPGAWPGPHVYNDAYTGWPVSPVDQQHPIRASFHDIRPGSFPTGLPGFHIGIDIAVRDDQPEPGAPPGRSHRVYAVEGGTVDLLPNVANVGCVNRRVTAGHFSYWHVDPVGVVADGQVIAPGQLIGWTCTTMWHVHLSEIQNVAGIDEWVNPLHPGGKLAPYVDTARARHRGCRALRAGGPRVAARRHGSLVARRRHPARPGPPLRPRRPARHGARTASRSPAGSPIGRRSPPTCTRTACGCSSSGSPTARSCSTRTRSRPTRTSRSPSTGTTPPARARTCRRSSASTRSRPRATAPCGCACSARSRRRTSTPPTLPNGTYRLALTAWDTQGNASPTTTLDVTIDNPAPAALPPAAPPPAAPPPDTRAPIAGIRLEPTARLGRALRQGLRVLVTCNEPCRLRVSVRLGPRAARRLGVAPTRTLAVVALQRVAAGRRVAVLRFPPRVRTLLRRAGHLDGVVTVVARDAAGNASTTARRIVVR